MPPKGQPSTPPKPIEPRDSSYPIVSEIQGKPRCSAFTLIEFLVVIAILGIVAALLLPVIANARKQAKKVGCISNLRQIDTATRLYAEDHDDKTFPGLPASDRYVPEWSEAMKRYTRSSDILFCPADGLAHRTYADGFTTYRRTLYTSYSEFLTGEAVYEDNLYHYDYSLMSSPSTQMHFADWMAPYRVPKGDHAELKYRIGHGTTWSVLYFDGHVKHTPCPWINPQE